MDKYLHLGWFLCTLSRALFSGFDQKGFKIEKMTQHITSKIFIFSCFSRTEALFMMVPFLNSASLCDCNNLHTLLKEVSFTDFVLFITLSMRKHKALEASQMTKAFVSLSHLYL